MANINVYRCQFGLLVAPEEDPEDALREFLRDISEDAKIREFCEHQRELTDTPEGWEVATQLMESFMLWAQKPNGKWRF